MLRALEVREPVATEPDEFLGGECRVQLADDKCFRNLAPAIVRDPNHADFKYAGMLHDDFLHLLARDVLAAGDDDVLGSIPQFDVSIGVPHREIARVEPSAVECLLGGL